MITLLGSSFLWDRATHLVQAGLAVVGAVFIGAIIIGFLVNLMTQIMLRKQLPASILRFTRVLGGLTSGFVVAMFVFGEGGWGFGGGTGTQSAGTGSTATENNVAASKDGATALTQSALHVGVTMLGGERVVASKFYRIDGDSVALTLAELQTRLSVAQTNAGAKFMTVRIYEDSVHRDHPAVFALESWAREKGWRVSTERMTGAMPAMVGAKS